MEKEQIEIDGSLYQGGGQIIRSCIALSVLLKKPFFIHSIRKNRGNPGINNQLRAILQPFLQKLPKNGSMEMTFEPSDPKIDKIQSNTSSSITLMLQCLIPIAVFTRREKQTKVQGGTDVSKSPPFESFSTCLIPLLEKMGIVIKIQTLKKGYYPKGNGFIVYSAILSGDDVKPIQMTQFSPPTNVTITYYLTKGPLPESHNDFKKEIKKMMRHAFGEDLQLDFDIKIQLVKGTKTPQYGIGLILRNQKVIWDCSIVGETTTEDKILQKLKHQISNKACLDDYHQDQLLIFMALAKGKSCIRIGQHKSDHTLSMLYVLKEFIPDIKITDQAGILTIEGINILKN